MMVMMLKPWCLLSLATALSFPMMAVTDGLGVLPQYQNADYMRWLRGMESC